MAAIIGKKGKDISRHDAAHYIFGYTIFNDWSARDEQKVWMDAGLSPGKGKDFDCSKSIGPCIVTSDEIGDPYNLTMAARVNGEEWGRGCTKDMHHKFEDAIADFSRSETLLPGEVLGSGTIAGGSGIDHGRRLKVEDVVELEIEKIGILRNKVIA
jgi:2-keto-4-pentenoate hydratase/2-oxohepta-3-ene-1,7-dioic acid hydratase in catechol pathway